MTISTSDEDGIRISGLDICAMETGLTVGMNSLGVISSSLRCKGMMKKRSIVDNNGVGTSGLRMSDLGETGLSLRYDGRPRHRQSSFKDSLARFCVESSILLCQYYILFF